MWGNILRTTVSSILNFRFQNQCEHFLQVFGYIPFLITGWFFFSVVNSLILPYWLVDQWCCSGVLIISGFRTWFCGLRVCCFTWSSAIKCTLSIREHDTGCRIETAQRQEIQTVLWANCLIWAHPLVENEYLVILQHVDDQYILFLPNSSKAALISALHVIYWKPSHYCVPSTNDGTVS